MYAIERGRHMPEVSCQRTGPAPKFPYRQMSVGDCFWVDGDERMVANIRTYSTRWSRSTGRKFSIRAEPGGCRVWCVA
jgi:hypothetical protein